MLKIGIFGRFLAEKKCIIEKENSLETLIAIVENVSPKGFFSDWMWRISKFQFLRRILDINMQTTALNWRVLLFNWHV